MSKISVAKFIRPSTSVQWPWEATNPTNQPLRTKYVLNNLAQPPVMDISNDGLQVTVSVEFIDEPTYQAFRVDLDIVENRKTTQTYCDNNGISFMILN
jgi:hypothetical protein